MRCKANGWTLHSRMEMEERQQLDALRSAIRENKAVLMEIVCHTYEEEWMFVLDFAAAEARWRVNDCRLMGQGRELTECGGGKGGGSQMKEKSGSSSSFSGHAALLTGSENSAPFKGLWFTPQHKPTVI